MATTYTARPIKGKRKRRTKAQMETLRDGLYDLACEYEPLTVRQLFYRAVATGLIDKTQTDYNNVVVRLLGQMREEKRIPFSWVVDNTRWMRKPQTHSSLRSMLDRTVRTYRRALWDNQHVYVEVWCESDSIAGVLYPVTQEFDVPLMPCGGQPSKSFVYGAAEAMADEDVPCYVYYLGDYDRSGVIISDRIERDLRRYLPDDAEFYFERVAINEDQIAEYDLPTRPPKDKRDGWTQTVELEAMTSADLQELCRNCIEQHIDQDVLERTRLVEEAERGTLETIIANLDVA